MTTATGDALPVIAVTGMAYPAARRDGAVYATMATRRSGRSCENWCGSRRSSAHSFGWPPMPARRASRS
ncbi:hypothetical protein OKW42_003239 [Paraburkholderia sp. WC7.3d]